MKAIIILILTFCLSNCSVQQVNVNTNIEPFSHGGRVFGEKTGGKQISKSRTIHIIGINAHAPNIEAMRQELNATSYTVETRHNFASLIITIFTVGIVSHHVVKVIKR